MSDNKDVDNIPEKGELEDPDTNIAAATSEVRSVAGSVKSAQSQHRVSSSSERQIKFERAQKCLENAALVSKRIKEHRKATAELLGRPFDDDDHDDSISEMASTVSERTSYSVATDTSTTLSVQEALNIPGISESLANTLKQKELLMERIKQYKEISRKPMYKSPMKKESITEKKNEAKSLSTSDAIQLNKTIKEKDNALSMVQVKMKAMEHTILDLQEKINEKDQIIESKNRATILMSENFNKKEKKLHIIIEDTRQQMTKMQENFIAIEGNWNDEKHVLIESIKDKDDKIKNLEEAKDILDDSRFKISIDQSKLMEELELKNNEILSLKEQITLMSKTPMENVVVPFKSDNQVEKANQSSETIHVNELIKKIDFLEQLNCQIRQTNKELENNLVKTTDSKSSTSSPSKNTKSPLPTRKGGRGGKSKSPWSNLSAEAATQEVEKKCGKPDQSKLEIVIQSLNKDIVNKEYEITQKNMLISELQSTNSRIQSALKELQEIVKTRKEIVNTIDVGILTEPTELIEPALERQSKDELDSAFVKDLESRLKEAQEQITSLTNEIEAANVNMIKVKSNHKLKLKQMQKTIDNFSKVSDSNAEIVKLNEEMHQLTQKVAELEEEKGNLQLHLVDYDSGRLTESDVYKKLIEMENIAEARLKSISVLEAQKFDLVQDLHVLQQKYTEMEDNLEDMSHLHSEQVSSEMKSVQLEEQVDELLASKKELELVVENLKLDKEHLNGTIKALEDDKEELNHKLQHFIQENIELKDKLEKLSAEKVSSAESIEIVESLTTQEKLELEEYNKGMTDNKADPHHTQEYKGTVSPECNENIEKLVEESAELNKKIELFTQERQEVMEKMGHISSENDSLQNKIVELTNKCHLLEINLNVLTKEKSDFEALIEELGRQIEDLKRERGEILKGSVETSKPASLEDVGEAIASDLQHDDKSTGDKAISRTKSVKQLTKEILKLKNTIKEREAEIGDCQMKILSLEEQQQKQTELIHSNATYESKIKALIEENKQLREELDVVKKDSDAEQQLIKLHEANNLLHLELQNIQQEYSNAINTRDARIHEVESLLLDYENQIIHYSNTLQQKDKDISEYINQITKLNDISQKLKSTIDMLEEEKSKDQNAELIKSLNKQITVFQRKLAEYEDKIRVFEEEKSQLLNLKTSMETKNTTLEVELKNLQEALTEKQIFIKELQMQQLNNVDEIGSAMLQAKERDEEIHEIKLQLRKESIENEKLRNTLTEKEQVASNFTKEYEEVSAKLQQLTQEKEELNEKYSAAETKTRELMEKLKKFAVNLKKKTTAHAALETELIEIQKQLEAKDSQLEHLLLQVESLPTVQENLKHANEELARLQVQNSSLEQLKSNIAEHLCAEVKATQDKLTNAVNEISRLTVFMDSLTKERDSAQEENASLNNQVETLNKKLVEYEIDQKNNTNFFTKMTSLETELNQKQALIQQLMDQLNLQEQQITQVRFGYDAKIQERDLYIETLDTEISKYKSRICRLEDTISAMEDRRHSLERKADQLGSQLQEKHKAYTEYTSQEDELINRLAVLMDHDRVVEKQLHEIESDNKELQFKMQHLSDENLRLKTALSDIQEYCNTLKDKASKADLFESEAAKYHAQVQDLDNQLKRITQDHQALLLQRKCDVEELESEFNTQIENAIKDKKNLSEKYEKTREHVNQLDSKLQEYVNNIQILNINIEELTKINQELNEKSLVRDNIKSVDYTEQYINEINRLNAMFNTKNQETLDLNNKIQSLQASHAETIHKLENDFSDLKIKHQQSLIELDRLTNKIHDLTQNNEHLQSLLSLKDDEIKQHSERNKMFFEINIPKTEGMVISSTIEALSHESRPFDLLSLESQILPAGSNIHPESKIKPSKISDHTQKQASQIDSGSGEVLEPDIVPKKAYMCYKGEQDIQEADPFNSDEGWGLGGSEEIADATPGLTHLQDQLQRLNNHNNALQNELQASNTKFLKAAKKLKELKAANDMLTNELKISKHISQSSFLDSAIEDELRINIQELEKKLEEISTALNKEKKEKEAIRKQNEIFNTANERLTEMKEKQDNEIELWKFKFKEINDKMSTLQWEGDVKDSPIHKPIAPTPDDQNSHLRDEIQKLEKENDELNLMIEQLNRHNKELDSQVAHKHEILSQNCEKLEAQLCEMSVKNLNLSQTIENLSKQLTEMEVQLNDARNIGESYRSDYEQLQVTFEHDQKELTLKNTILQEELSKLKLAEADTSAKTTTLDIENLSKQLVEVELQLNNAKNNAESYKSEFEKLQEVSENSRKEMIRINNGLQEELSILKLAEADAVAKSTALAAELEEASSKNILYEKQNKKELNATDNLIITEKFAAVEEQSILLNSALEESQNKIAELKAENSNLLDKVKDYELQINELNQKLLNLNTENDQLLSTVAELRNSVSTAVDQRGFEIAELWKQHLAQREADFQNAEHELRSQLSASEAKYEQLLDHVQSSSQEETNKLIMMEQVNSLQSKLQDKEEHLLNLQDKYSEAISQLDMLRSEMEDEKHMHENKLLVQQEEYEKQIQEINDKNEKAISEEINNPVIQTLELQLSSTKEVKNELTNQLCELNKKLQQSEAKISELNSQLQMRESDIYQKTHDYTIALAQRNEEFEIVRRQLVEYEKKVEDLSYEKESELAVLRLKMHDKNEDFDRLRNEFDIEKNTLAQELNDKIVECTNLNKQIADLNKLLEEYSVRANETQAALENQEYEIVTLKDEIYSLQAMLRSSSSRIEKHVTFASDTKPAPEGEAAEEALNSDLLDAVPRAELDLALYMLHQRDVRCEELTMELTQLLEERDTLQLRLSDSLRSCEEFKAKCVAAGLDASTSSSQEVAEASLSFERETQFVDTHRGASRSSSISDPDGDKPKLQAKLSELRTVRHSRDVRLRQDSEARQLGMRLMHRDVAQLPPEAMQQLAQAHHTLSRDSQSTSTVLLNWLRGKSTPKVVHM